MLAPPLASCIFLGDTAAPRLDAVLFPLEIVVDIDFADFLLGIVGIDFAEFPFGIFRIGFAVLPLDIGSPAIPLGIVYLGIVGFARGIDGAGAVSNPHHYSTGNCYSCHWTIIAAVAADDYYSSVPPPQSPSLPPSTAPGLWVHRRIA